MATVQLFKIHLTRKILVEVKPSDKAEIVSEIKAVSNPGITADNETNGFQRTEVLVDRWIKSILILRSIIPLELNYTLTKLI